MRGVFGRHSSPVFLSHRWGGQRDEWSEDVTSSGSEVAREQILDEAHRKKLNREK